MVVEESIDSQIPTLMFRHPVKGNMFNAVELYIIGLRGPRSMFVGCGDEAGGLAFLCHTTIGVFDLRNAGFTAVIKAVCMTKGALCHTNMAMPIHATEWAILACVLV